MDGFVSYRDDYIRYELDCVITTHSVCLGWLDCFKQLYIPSALSTYLLKSCPHALSPLITDIIHSSLYSGVVPSSLNTAAITPTIKKPGADPNDLNKFRPISNLPFLSKILETTVAAQLNTHLSHYNLFEQFQSSFHPLHSTETPK